MSNIASDTAGKAGRYSVPYDKKKSEILDVSFNDEWVQKLEKQIEQKIPLILKKNHPDRTVG
jgi:hypothetical protein